MAETGKTKRFYDEIGWQEQDGVPVDRILFGVKEDGRIRIDLHRLHLERIRSALSQAGPPLNLLECGCGANPEKALLNLCSKYTGVDFSHTGLAKAQSFFADAGIAHEFQAADICALPFADGTFDGVYCAHVIYHIEDTVAQETAIAELLRVVRPGGVAVVIAANPRPLLFPVRLARRLAADTPVVGPLLNRLRSKPPLPYKPMSIGWMQRRMARAGPVDAIVYSIPSTAFYQNVTEFKGVGKLLWRGIRWLDVHCPHLSAYLGNYVMLSCRKASMGTSA
jgi:ubiquinone/menaquinone biosynthesis C-methylase UbiE